MNWNYQQGTSRASGAKDKLALLVQCQDFTGKTLAEVHNKRSRRGQQACWAELILWKNSDLKKVIVYVFILFNHTQKARTANDSFFIYGYIYLSCILYCIIQIKGYPPVTNEQHDI